MLLPFSLWAKRAFECAIERAIWRDTSSAATCLKITYAYVRWVLIQAAPSLSDAQISHSNCVVFGEQLRQMRFFHKSRTPKYARCSKTASFLFFIQISRSNCVVFWQITGQHTSLVNSFTLCKLGLPCGSIYLALHLNIALKLCGIWQITLSYAQISH